MTNIRRKSELSLRNIIKNGNADFLREHLTKSDLAMLEEIIPSIKLSAIMGQCFWLGTKNYKTIYVNSVYEKLSGYSLAKAFGKPSDFCFDEEGKKTIAENHKLRDRGQASQYEATMIAKSGKKIPLLITGVPTNKGGAMGIFVDISKVKEIEKNEILAGQIIRHSGEAIIVLDRNRKIQMWNTGAEKIFGYREKEVLSKSVNVIVPKEDIELSEKILRGADEKKYIRNIDTTRLRKDGSLVDVSISVTTVADEKDELFGYLVLYHDISDQKKLGNELQKRFEAVQDAYKELGLQKRQMDYLAEIADLTVNQKASLAELEDLIVSAVYMLTKADAVILRLYDRKNKVLKLVSSLGVGQKWVDKGNIPYRNSIVEDAFRVRRPLLIDNVGSALKYKGVKVLREHQFSTMISIPLFVEEKLVGSMNLYAKDPLKFRLLETDFLENFGKTCSISLYLKALKEV